MAMKSWISLIVAAVGAAGLAGAALGEQGFAGTWKVSDTSGKPFEIVLKDDGSASANRAGEGMKGSWKKDGASAVITWDTGWVTKITDKGGKFEKTAFKEGASPTGKPTNTSKAEKVK